MSPPLILAVGGAHIDRRGRMAQSFIPGASIPGTMREEVGGGAFNALRCAVQRGSKGAMFSIRGGDPPGEAVALALAHAGIADLSAVFLDRTTPSYTALLDQAGDVVAALANMQLYDIAFPKQMRRSAVRDALRAADAIIADANVPAEGLRHLCSTASGKPLFAIAISPAKAVRLREVLPALTCLYLNRREAAALAGTDADASIETLIGALKASGLSCGVVTHGQAPAFAFDASATVSVTPPTPRGIADVTGAGDALAGVMSVALLGGAQLGEALRHGVAAATLAVASETSVPRLSHPAFAEVLALVPQAMEMG